MTKRNQPPQFQPIPSMDDLVKSGIRYTPTELPTAQQDGDENRSSFSRQHEIGWRQLPQTAGSLAWYAGDVADKAGMSWGAGLRDWGLDVYGAQSKKIQELTRDSDSFTNLLTGKGYANTYDFVTGAGGYVLSQAEQAVLTLGVGALIGKIGATQALKYGLRGALEQGVQNEAAKLATQQTVSRAAKLGAGSALYGLNTMQEVGSIYPQAVEQAHKEGRELTGADLAKVGALGLGAAGVDTAMDALMLGRLTKGGRGGSLVRRGMREIPAGMTREAATEGIQTVMERYGAGQSLGDQEAWRDYIDSAALGAVGGGMGGAAASIRSQKVAEVGPLSRAANTGTEIQAQYVESMEAAGAAEGARMAEQDRQMAESGTDPIMNSIMALEAGPARTEALRAYRIARREDMPVGVRRHNERILNNILAQAEAQTPARPGPLMLGYDQTPTGHMIAGEEGVRPETRADLINRAQEVQRQTEDRQRMAELGMTPDIVRLQSVNPEVATLQSPFTTLQTQAAVPPAVTITTLETNKQEPPAPRQATRPENVPQPPERPLKADKTKTPPAPAPAGVSVSEQAPFKTLEEANAYLSHQRRSGGSFRIQALPLPVNDGFALIAKDDSRYPQAEAFKQKQALRDAGVQDTDILMKSGIPFKNKAAVNLAWKRAGQGSHEVVLVKGGFVVRPKIDSTPIIQGDKNALPLSVRDDGSSGASMPGQNGIHESVSSGHSVESAPGLHKNGQKNQQTTDATGGEGISGTDQAADKQPALKQKKTSAEKTSKDIQPEHDKEVPQHIADKVRKLSKPLEDSTWRMVDDSAHDAGFIRLVRPDSNRVVSFKYDPKSGTDHQRAYAKAKMWLSQQESIEEKATEQAEQATEHVKEVEQQSDKTVEEKTQEPASPKQKKEEQKPVENKAPPAKTEKVTDAGEQLRNNRRNFTNGLQWADVAEMNDAQKVKAVTKEKVWPRPNWEEVIDSLPADKKELGTVVSRLVKSVYDALPKSPSGTSDAHLQAYIEGMHKLQQAAESLIIDSDKQGLFIRSINNWGKAMQGKVGTLSGMDKPVNTNDLRPLFTQLFPDQANGARFVRGTPANDLALVYGSKALKAMQWNLDDAVAAMKDIKSNGWPAKQEAWQKSYTISDSNSLKHNELHVYDRDKKPLGNVEKSDIQQFFVTSKKQGWRSYSPTGKASDAAFNTKEQAEEFARELGKRERKNTPEVEGLSLGQVERQGPQRREGNVTADQFRDAFGFRGVNFGNWMNQTERQTHLNHAYDSMHDLSEILNLPAKAMSLNGMLGIAFGAQGKGKAAAHFVPGDNEINITKRAGAGALAHEWGHGLDHYFSVQRDPASARTQDPFLSVQTEQKDAKNMRPELFKAFETIVSAMNKRIETPDQVIVRLREERTKAEGRLSDRLDAYIQVAKNNGKNTTELISLAQKIKSDDSVIESEVTPSIAEFQKHYNDLNLPYPMNGTDASRLTALSLRAQSFKDAQKFQRMHQPQTTSKTDFLTDSLAKDKEGRPYWGSPQEMFARALESFVLDRLSSKARRDDYLVHPRADGTDEKWAGLYPSGVDRETINQAFDTLFAEIKSKETDNGNVALFSRDDEKKTIPGMHGSTLRQHIHQIVSKWTNRPEGGVHVVQSVSDLPAEVRDAILSGHAEGDVRGLMRPGTHEVYLVADHLANTQEAEQVLFHEVYGHYGLRRILGADYSKELTRLRMANQHLASEASYWFALYGQDKIDQLQQSGLSNIEAERMTRLIAMEEALSERAAQAQPITGWKTFMATLQSALRALGLGSVASWMESHTEAETLTMLRRARESVQGDTQTGSAHTFGRQDADVFNRDEQGYRFATEFLNEMAAHEEIFRYPLSPSKSLKAVFSDIDPEVKYLGEDTRPDEKEESGADTRHVFRTAQGANVYVYERGKEVWLDVSRLQRGQAGDAIYHALANYAYNNDKRFMGDPAGLSHDAIIRRTYHMLGSALRFGTTDHFQPAPEQLTGIPEKGIPGLKWEGNDADKVASLAKTFTDTLFKENPELARYGYDFKRGTFTDPSGAAIPRNGILLGLRTRTQAGVSGYRRSPAAGVLLHALSRAESSERPGLLALVLRRSSQLVKDVGPGPLFSRSTTAPPGGFFSPEGPTTDARVAPYDQSELREKITDLFKSNRTFNVWHRTVGTQLHKALKDKHFKKVYDATQVYLNGISRFANDAASLAPDLLPSLENMKDAFKGFASQQDIAAIRAPLFQGTLEDKRTYSPDELRSIFKLNDKQIEMYQQFRASVDRSLSNLTTATMGKLLLHSGLEPVVEAALETGHYQSVLNAVRDKAQHEPYFEKLARQIEDVAERADTLKNEAYAPLMRFGQYAVSVRHPQAGTLEAFYMFDSRREANAKARELQKQHPDSVVEQSVMSQEDYKLLDGLSPESLSLFGDLMIKSGVFDTDEKYKAMKAVIQTYIQEATVNHSALKRMLKREGYKGYSEDLQRVLASFITSNARLSSRHLYMTNMLEAAENIPQAKGDVRDEAAKLVDFVRDPQENGAGIRSFLFAYYIGGSVASALTNMTQPLTMTLPWLSQYGGAGKTASELMAALKTGVTGKIHDKTLQAALHRAEKEGLVSPQEIHQLQAVALDRGSFPAEVAKTIGLPQSAVGKIDEYGKKGLFLWGSLFSAAEQFNRRVTFVAAYKVAQSMSPEALKKAGVKDAYEFASRAIAETQGVYNPGNRPNWGRSTVGSVVMTFKQFTIGYLEFLMRLPRKEQAMALGILLLSAGVGGLPFSDDLDDLIDSLGQHMGFNTNAKQWKARFLASWFGRQTADVMIRGFSALPGMPLDVSWRMGMSNLVPGSGILRKDHTNNTREVFDALGPAGGLVSNLLQGNPYPTTIRNVKKAYDIISTGMYRDDRGRKVMDATAIDAAMKLMGFQPSAVARAQNAMGIKQQSINMARNTETEIASQWALGLFERDTGKVESARERMKAWNRNNPETPIKMNLPQVLRRVREMRQTKEDRQVKAAPKELRGYAGS